MAHRSHGVVKTRQQNGRRKCGLGESRANLAKLSAHGNSFARSDSVSCSRGKPRFESPTVTAFDKHIPLRALLPFLSDFRTCHAAYALLNMDSLVVGTVPGEPEVNIDVDGLVDELSAARLEVDRFVSNHESGLSQREAAFRKKTETYEGMRVVLRVWGRLIHAHGACAGRAIRVEEGPVGGHGWP